MEKGAFNNLQENKEKTPDITSMAGKDGNSILLMDKDKQIGTLEFKQDKINNVIEIKRIKVELDYSGKSLGLKLYEALISLAKENNIKIIRSDSHVQSGAVATWFKLSKDYKVKVHPAIAERFEEFKKAYDSKNYYSGGPLSVPRGEHVFELDLN